MRNICIYVCTTCEWDAEEDGGFPGSGGLWTTRWVLRTEPGSAGWLNHHLSCPQMPILFMSIYIFFIFIFIYIFFHVLFFIPSICLYFLFLAFFEFSLLFLVIYYFKILNFYIFSYYFWIWNLRFLKFFHSM